MHTIVLTIHLLSAILFIGTVYFRTFAILPYCKKEDFMQKAYELSGKKGRFIAYFFVTTLLLSGLYLGYTRDFVWKTSSIAINIKMFLGLLAISIFYFAQKITKRFKHIPNFIVIFHRGLFTIMILIVLIAKLEIFLI